MNVPRVQLRHAFCPCCGARSDSIPQANAQVSSQLQCQYCDALLLVEPQEILWPNAPRSRPQTSSESGDLERSEWPCRLYAQATCDFEMSVVRQELGNQGEGAGEQFSCLSYEEGTKFAFVYLRIVDKSDGKVVPHYPLPIEAVDGCLSQHFDPGLAAYAALEYLCASDLGFPYRLEISIALFDGQHCTLKFYGAGNCNSHYLLSRREGRLIEISGRHRQGLEKKQLHDDEAFANMSTPLWLDSQDRYLFLSASLADGPLYEVHEQLRDEVGEEPLALITRAKNAYWKKLRGLPTGPIVVAAVRALQPPLLETVAPVAQQQFATRCYQMTINCLAQDFVEIHPLHNNRHAVIWASRGPDLEFFEEDAQRLRQEILAVLDRPDHGDNENPRQAGRNALAAVDCAHLLVVQIFDQWERVKYFRGGWAHPIYLGARGERGGGIQAFDGGGEVTVEAGARLFFPGSLIQWGEPTRLEDFSRTLPRGYACRLHDALRTHWKIPDNRACLDSLQRAFASEVALRHIKDLALLSNRSH